MKKNILITGAVKSGKSTLLGSIIQPVAYKVGFVTEEIRIGGVRVGFKIVTSAGKESIFAHVDFRTPYPVAKYHVDIEQLESLLPDIELYQPRDLLYIDEIGQMQLLSETFKKTVTTFLDTPNTTIMTISSVFQDSFIDAVKARGDVILVEITPETRDERLVYINGLLGKIEKAKGYVSEPGRFVFGDTHVTLTSSHGTRRLTKTADNTWSCTCDFYAQYSICSHAIATEELIS